MHIYIIYIYIVPKLMPFSCLWYSHLFQFLLIAFGTGMFLLETLSHVYYIRT